MQTYYRVQVWKCCFITGSYRMYSTFCSAFCWTLSLRPRPQTHTPGRTDTHAHAHAHAHTHTHTHTHNTHNTDTPAWVILALALLDNGNTETRQEILMYFMCVKYVVKRKKAHWYLDCWNYVDTDCEELHQTSGTGWSSFPRQEHASFSDERLNWNTNEAKNV